MNCSPHVILHGKCGGCGQTPAEIVDEIERQVRRPIIIDLDYDEEPTVLSLERSFRAKSFPATGG